MIKQGFEFINLKSGRSNLSSTDANIMTDEDSQSDIDDQSAKMMKF